MFHLRRNQVVGFYEKSVWKTPVEEEWHFTRPASYNVTLSKVFFKHLASKNQLPGLSVSRTFVKNVIF